MYSLNLTTILVTMVLMQIIGLISVTTYSLKKAGFMAIIGLFLGIVLSLLGVR